MSLIGVPEHIATTVLSGTAGSIRFDFPASYRILMCDVYIANDANDKDVTVTLNNDTGSNYDYQDVSVDAGSVSGARVTGAAGWLITTHEDFDASQDYYASFYVAKSTSGIDAQLLHQISYRGVGDEIVYESLIGQWSNTANLITRLDITASSNNFAAASAASLWGVRL